MALIKTISSTVRYKEIAQYSANKPTGGNNFTQVVWKSSTKVGIGITETMNEGKYFVYVVAYFYIMGNKGNFVKNVMPLKPTDTTTTKSPVQANPRGNAGKNLSAAIQIFL